MNDLIKKMFNLGFAPVISHYDENIYEKYESGIYKTRFCYMQNTEFELNLYIYSNEEHKPIAYEIYSNITADEVYTIEDIDKHIEYCNNVKQFLIGILIILNPVINEFYLVDRDSISYNEFEKLFEVENNA